MRFLYEAVEQNHPAVMNTKQDPRDTADTTPANRAAMPQADYAAWPKTEEVAATILFLASPDNKVTRGGVVPVYGRS